MFGWCIEFERLNGAEKVCENFEQVLNKFHQPVSTGLNMFE
jgi:hypothetical protein